MTTPLALATADLAPGALFLLLAVPPLWLLHRFYDRLPWPAVAGFGAIVLVLLAPVLVGGQLLLPLDGLRGEVPFTGLAPTEPHGNVLQGDLLQLVVPAAVEGRRAVTAGRWPLWSARMGAGMPLLADPQAQLLQPLALPLLLLPPERGAGVVAALRLLAALVGTFLFLRRLGRAPIGPGSPPPGLQIGPAGAFAGAVAWGLGGFVQLWLGWPIATAAALLPVLLYAVSRAVDLGGRRDFALLVVTTWALLLAGHPQTILYSLLLAAAFGLLRWRATRGGSDDGPAARTDRRPALRPLAAGLLALALAAPALLPAAAALPRSLRAERLADPARPAVPESLADPGRRALTRLLPIAAPNAFGNSRYAAYWGGENSNEDAAGFVGTITLLLALLAVTGGMWRRPLPQERLFAGASALSLLAVALPPPLPWLLRTVPLGPLSGDPHRLLMVLGFSLTVLAACELSRRRRRIGGLASLAAVALALAAVVAWGYLSFPHPERPETLAVLRIGWLHWQLRFLVGGTLVLGFLHLVRTDDGSSAAANDERGEREREPGTVGRLLVAARPLRRLAIPALAVAIAAELLLAHAPANPPAPPRLAFPTPPPLAFLQRQLGGSTDAAGGATGGRLIALGEALPPNLAAVYGLADARLYNPIAPAAYQAALAPLIDRWDGEVPRFGVADHPLLDRLGVRYVLAAPGVELAPPLAPVHRDPAGWVWQRPAARPLLHPAEGAPSGAALTPLPQPGAERLAAHYSSPAPLPIASGLYQDGGWRLLVDGRRLATGRDGPFLAATLPARTEELDAQGAVDLLYRPASFLWGMLLAAIGLAAGAAWLLPAPRAR